jgi:hypothetical protein
MKMLKMLMIAINATASILFTLQGIMSGTSLSLLGIIALVFCILSFIPSSPLNKLLYCSSSVMLASASAAIAYASAAGTSIYLVQSYQLIEVAGTFGAFIFIILALIACSGAW